MSVAKDRLIISVKYCLPVPVFHFWLKLTHLQRGLSAAAEHLVKVNGLPHEVQTLGMIDELCK